MKDAKDVLILQLPMSTSEKHEGNGDWKKVALNLNHQHIHSESAQPLQKAHMTNI
jgi:hypothetical protein